MGKEKDFLLAEKCELERIIAEIPEESVLDKLSFEARLKKVNEDLSNLEKSEEIKEPDDSMFGRLAQIEAQIMELRARLSTMEDAYHRQEKQCFGKTERVEYVNRRK